MSSSESDSVERDKSDAKRLARRGEAFVPVDNGHQKRPHYCCVQPAYPHGRGQRPGRVCLSPGCSMNPLRGCRIGQVSDELFQVGGKAGFQSRDSRIHRQLYGRVNRFSEVGSDGGQNRLIDRGPAYGSLHRRIHRGRVNQLVGFTHETPNFLKLPRYRITGVRVRRRCRQGNGRGCTCGRRDGGNRF